MKQQINSLTSTRAVAAIMVVIHHFGFLLLPYSLSGNLFQTGNVAVSYFFVLSGFVLYISYNGVIISYGDYIKRRIARIVPLYLFALLLMICVAHLFLHYSFTGKAFKEIALSALFIQAYVPSYPLVINSPAWSLSVEMFFYLLFPLFLVVLNKNKKLFVGLVIVLYVLAQYFHLKYYMQRWSLPDSIVDTVFFNPVMHINQFMIGMLGGYLFVTGNTRIFKQKYLPLVLFGVVLLLLLFKPVRISYQVGLIAPVFMLFILSVAVNDPVSLKGRAFVFLGEISYGIYILQFPIIKCLEVLNTRYMHMPPQLFFYVAMAVLILSASASYYVIEKPLRKKINGLTLKVS